MFSRFPELRWRLAAGAIACCGLLGGGAMLLTEAWAAAAAEDGASPRRVIRIGADPNNLPFSNQRLEGFENKLATLIAGELDADIEYVWRAQRRGFFRESLKENRVDLVMGVPAGFEMALPTNPYYRSTYVFVSRRDRKLGIESLDDPRLRDLDVGVHLVGDDGFNPPPAHALARRGMIENVIGFTIYGDYREENPPARIIDAVRAGEIDLAIVWGPLAGYFASQGEADLALAPVQPQLDPPALSFAFSIAMGVRKQDTAFRDELNQVLAQKQGEVEQILDAYALPRLPLEDRTAGGLEGSAE